MNADTISLLTETAGNAASPPPVHTTNGSSGYDSQEAYNRNWPPANSEDPPRLPQYVATISATLSALACGLVLGWTSPIMEELKAGKFNGISINENQMGWIGSFTTLGAMTMCLPTGFICDIIGRKKTLLLLIVPFTIGWLFILFSKSVLMLYFGRLIAGMAVGATCVVAPLYTNEIAHKDVRGTLGSYFQLMITTGIFLAYLIGKYLDPLPFTIICSLVPFIFIVCMSFQPESPIFFLQKFNYIDAIASFGKLRGGRHDVTSEVVEAENAIKERRQVPISLAQTFGQRATRRALFLSLSLMFFQQFSGVNAVILYTSDIFESTSMKLDPNSAAIIVGAFQALATFISSLLVDRLGRRLLLCISSLVMSLSLASLAMYFFLKYREKVSDETLSELGFVPVLSLCVYIIMFAIGFGPIPWMYASEIFSPDIKSVAVSAAGTFNWFLAFLITKFYLQVKESIGVDSTFSAFAAFTLLSMLFVFYFIPETKGKSVEEIQNELNE